MDNFITNGLGSANPNLGVPEPATRTMMIAGFGLMGASMRRRSVRFNTAAT